MGIVLQEADPSKEVVALHLSALLEKLVCLFLFLPPLVIIPFCNSNIPRVQFE